MLSTHLGMKLSMQLWSLKINRHQLDCKMTDITKYWGQPHIKIYTCTTLCCDDANTQFNSCTGELSTSFESALVCVVMHHANNTDKPPHLLGHLHSFVIYIIVRVLHEPCIFKVV